MNENDPMELFARSTIKKLSKPWNSLKIIQTWDGPSSWTLRDSLPQGHAMAPKGPQNSQNTLFLDKTHMEKTNAQNLIKVSESKLSTTH